MDQSLNDKRLLKRIVALENRLEALENHIAEIDLRSEAMFFPVHISRTSIGNDSFGYKPICKPEIQLVD